LLQRREGNPLIEVLGFGIAKLVRPDEGMSLLTRTGQALGTPIYMAPEQFRDASRVDERTDVYSIGAVLYELFARQVPFDAPTIPQIVMQVLEKGPPPLRTLRPDLPRAVCDVVHRAMARDPSKRFASAGELTAALRRSPSQTPSQTPSRTATPPAAVRSTVDAFAATAAAGVSAVARLEAEPKEDHQAAVVEAAGRVSRVLEEGPPDIRAQLRSHVAVVESGKPLPADDRLWTPLADGRWTLIDRFEMNGQRYYVAIDNDRESQELCALSDRERSVVQLAAQGLANKEIAYELQLADSSVATYLRRALEKLRIQDRLELPLIFQERARTITVEGSRLMVSKHGFSRRPELTDAEQQVAEMAAQGLTDRQIAAARSCSPRTVANLLRAAYQKLGVANRSALVRALTITAH